MYVVLTLFDSSFNNFSDNRKFFDNQHRSFSQTQSLWVKQHKFYKLKKQTLRSLR